MKPAKFARLKEILLQASDLAGEERRAYLDQACADDPELRREAEAILARGALKTPLSCGRPAMCRKRQLGPAASPTPPGEDRPFTTQRA